MPRIQGQFSSKSSDETSEEVQNIISLDNLKDVLLLGKLTEKVQIGGFIFEISTISTKEQKEIINKVMSMQVENKMFDIRPATLSYALKTINGVNIEALCNDDKILDPSDRRLDVIQNLQTNLVERLFKTYEKLLEESNRQIGLEDIKK